MGDSTLLQKVIGCIDSFVSTAAQISVGNRPCMIKVNVLVVDGWLICREEVPVLLDHGML